MKQIGFTIYNPDDTRKSGIRYQITNVDAIGNKQVREEDFVLGSRVLSLNVGDVLTIVEETHETPQPLPGTAPKAIDDRAAKSS